MKEKKEQPEKEVRKTKEWLRYVFTVDERRDLADQMAQAVMDRDKWQDALKTAQTQIKSEIARAEELVSQTANKLNAGFEMRNIDCKAVYDFDSNTVTITRLDNQEIARTRVMTAEERQEELEL